MASEKPSPRDAKFNRALYSAAQSLGWFLPQTEEEVAAAEELHESSDAAAGFDPLEALDREPVFSKRPPAAAVREPEAEAEFRRAARLGGGEVSEEVEERMRRDRRRAEKDADDN